MDHQKKEAEIKRLEKEASFHASKNYFIILIVVLTVVYVVDELASNIKGYTQNFVIYDFFNTTINTQVFADASANLQLISTACYLVLIIAPFYKSLADKFGRRLFLIINTLGMGVGMLVCAIAPNFITFILGTLILSFFTPNDVQVMYIMECAPKEHRAKLAALTKGIALMSVSMIGLFINWFYNRDVVSTWRKIYIIPVALALVVGLMAIFMVRETPVFTKRRLALLKGEEAAEDEEAAEKNDEASVPKAIKYIFTHKQTQAIALAGIIFSMSTGFTNLYGTVIEAGFGTGALSEADTGMIYTLWPIINGIFTFVGGIFTDSLGRKKASVLLGIWAVAGLALFVLGCAYGYPSWLTGFGYGLYAAGLWSISDLLYIIVTAESVPTQIRASVMGSMSLIGMVGTGFSWIFNAFITKAAGTAKLGRVLMFIYLPIMCISIVIILLRIKETKGVDMDHVEDE